MKINEREVNKPHIHTSISFYRITDGEKPMLHIKELTESEAFEYGDFLKNTFIEKYKALTSIPKHSI